MATVSPSKDYRMDTLDVDDKMQMATSPNPNEDDLDLDLDLLQDPGVEHSMLDDTDFNAGDIDSTQPVNNISYDDEYMFDDTATDHATMEDVPELSMDTYEHNTEPDRDEEILYDEEEIGSGAKVDTMEDIGEELHVDIADENNTAEFIEQDLDYDGEQEHAKIDMQHTNHDNNDTVVTETDNVADDFDNAPPMTPSQSHDDHGPVVENAFSTIENGKPIMQEQENTGLNDYGDELSPTHTRTSDNSANLNLAEAADSYAEHDVISDAQDLQHKESDIEPQVTTSDSQVEPVRGEGSEPLHPVTVIYLGQEMSLFPPLNDDPSSTFFVTEVNLAYESIDKLLSACRSVLGDSLEHDDELVLDIPTLGLHICEDSKYASELKLEQIIDVYLSLSRNDDIVEVGPLSCNLSSRVCLASQFTYLNNAARDGKPYSEIVAEHTDSPDAEAQEYHDDLPEEQEQDVDTAADVTNDALEDYEDREDNDKSSGAHEDNHPLFNPNPDHESNEMYSESARPETLKGQDIDEHPEMSTETGEYSNQDQDKTNPHPEDNGAFQNLEYSVVGEEQEFADDGKHEQPSSAAPHDAIHEQNSIDPTTPSSHTVEADQDNFIESTAVVSESVNITAEVDQHSLAVDEHLPNQPDEDQHGEEERENFDLPHEQQDIGQTTLDEADVLEDVDNVLEDEEDEEEDLFAPDLEVDADADATIQATFIHAGADIDEHDGAKAIDQLNTANQTDGGNITSLHVDQIEILQPTTPSKQVGGKRKVSENDDDPDLFEFDTPEPKRRRPS